MYTAHEWITLKRIVNVFEDYIRNSPFLALAVSEKIGYLLFTIDTHGHIISQPIIIQSPEHLCSLLFLEIAYDVLEKSPEPDLNLSKITSEEKAQIRRNLSPFLTRLPEYQHLADHLLDTQHVPKQTQSRQA